MSSGTSRAPARVMAVSAAAVFRGATAVARAHEIPEATTAPAIAARWRDRALKPRAIAAALALIFFGLIGLAHATGHWQTDISRDVYMTLVPHADDYGHQESLR